MTIQKTWYPTLSRFVRGQVAEFRSATETLPQDMGIDGVLKRVRQSPLLQKPEVQSALKSAAQLGGVIGHQTKRVVKVVVDVAEVAIKSGVQEARDPSDDDFTP